MDTRDYAKFCHYPWIIGDIVEWSELLGWDEWAFLFNQLPGGGVYAYWPIETWRGVNFGLN